LHIETRDTGIGVAAEDLTRIFDAFVQIDEATVAGSAGLGLGLSISALLMKEQGGRIWATSEGRGRGSTFHIEVPLATTRSIEEPEQNPSLAPTQQSYRILIVEDHEPTRSTLARLLTRRGHEVECAESIATARVTAQRSAFDLVISDVGLPDGDGRSLMRQIYGDLGMPGIALSGYGTDTDIQKSLDAGFGAHLTKPVDFDELDRAIAEVMRDRQTRSTKSLPPGD
jgi:CheY-like chemotaxis protein